jgi:hypothetical protein
MELSTKKTNVYIDSLFVDSIDTGYSSAGKMGKEGQWPIMRKCPGCLLDSTDDLI